MKRFAWVLVILLLSSFLLVNCRRGDSPAAGIGKKVTEKLEFDDTDKLELTEKEVKAFIKAFPDFKEAAEKEGEKLESISKKGVLGGIKGGREYMKSAKKLNKVLKPYGFTMDTFLQTFSKVMATYGYKMSLEAKKLAKDNIGAMKKMLDNPMLSEEEKDEIRESIKELEEMDDSEEAKAYKKNLKILEKYEDELEIVFEGMKD
jgi:hypothetical protein